MRLFDWEMFPSLQLSEFEVSFMVHKYRTENEEIVQRLQQNQQNRSQSYMPHQLQRNLMQVKNKSEMRDAPELDQTAEPFFFCGGKEVLFR